MSDSDSTQSGPINLLAKSRGWLIFAGIVSIFVGFLAISAPVVFSAAIVWVIGVFAVVTGAITFVLAIAGKHQGHRILEAILAIIRIAAGAIILGCVTTGLMALTLVLAIFFMVEGFHSIVAAIQMRAHKGWVWTLISGIAALVLGLMVLNRWPSDSAAIIGLLYGINSIFWGSSVLALGFGAPKQAAS